MPVMLRNATGMHRQGDGTRKRGVCVWNLSGAIAVGWH